MRLAMVGRPQKTRVKNSGEKIRKALEIWGKTWGRKDFSDNHVTHWDRWQNNQLPLSSTTIRNDIQNGIPIERLDAYSKCLNLPKDVLSNNDLSAESSKFRNILLSHCNEETYNSGIAMFDNPLIVHAHEKYNNYEQLYDLLGIISGTYECFWIESEKSNYILKCSLSIDEIKNGCISARACYMYYDVEHHIEPTFFRWNKNLHMFYFSDQHSSMSHLMFLDPLSFRTIQYRKEFYLKGKQLSDNGLINSLPTVSYVYFKKIEDAKYEDITKNITINPHIHENDENFEEIKKMILSPIDI